MQVNSDIARHACGLPNTNVDQISGLDQVLSNVAAGDNIAVMT